MENIFILNKATDPDVIGADYPQCVGVLKAYDNTYENNKSLYYFAHYKGKYVQFVPDLGSIKVSAKAKLTDIISCSMGPGNDLIVSPRMCELLTEYKTSEIQIFDCVLTKKDVKYKYYWLHFIYSLEKKVDYKRSILNHVDPELRSAASEISSFDQFDDFYNTRDEYGLVYSSKLTLKSNKLDFFLVGRMDQKIYLSERLKNEIQKCELTGIEFEIAHGIGFV